MNVFKKYCPNVWVAECDEKHDKGEVITLETQYGKEVECKVYNLVAEKNGKFYYSVVRLEENYATRKAENTETHKPRTRKRALIGIRKAKRAQNF